MFLSTRLFTGRSFRTLALLFCFSCFGVFPALAASKVIADFSKETSPYILNDGDDLTITTSVSPAAPFEIRINGGAASIEYKPAGPRLSSPENLYITSPAAVALTLKNFVFTPPADRHGIDLAGDSRLLLYGYSVIYAGDSRTAALIYVPRGRSLTIDSADKPGSTKDHLSAHGIIGTFNAAEPAGTIRVDGGRLGGLMVVQGEGLNFVFNRGFSSINTLNAGSTGSFIVNGGSLEVGTLMPPLRPKRNGEALGYITFSFFSDNNMPGGDMIRFSIAGMPEYDVSYNDGSHPPFYFLPAGTWTVMATQGSRSASVGLDIDAGDTVERKRLQVLDLTADAQYPTLPPADSVAHDRVTLPNPNADGSYNTVSAIPSYFFYILLSAMQSGTRLEAGRGYPGYYNRGWGPTEGFILDKGQVEITANVKDKTPDLFLRARTLLLLRDGTSINAADSGATIRARFDPRCTSTSVELVSGSLDEPLPQSADGADSGDGCPANAITPPRSRYALQDGTLACASERLKLTGTYAILPYSVHIPPGGLSASYPVTLTAGQSVLYRRADSGTRARHRRGRLVPQFRRQRLACFFRCAVRAFLHRGPG